MSAKLTRWTGAEPPKRNGLDRLIRDEGLTPALWSNGPHDRYAPHSHSYHKVLY